jgi:hypothetical protein
MTLRFSLLTISLFFYSFSQAQDKLTLNNQDGIYVTYELTKIEEGSKKDTYLAVVKAENKNDYDVFYSIPLTKQANGSTAISILENKLFAQSSVRNSTGLFGDNINLTGQETKLITNDNKILYSISKGNFITAEKEFKVKKGAKPILTNTFLLPLKSIDNFDIAVNEATINGDWISNCGNIQMTLTMAKNEKNETVIQQLINGKQNIWRKTTANTFEKLNDKTTTLSYNKQNNSFSYSTTDGVSCVWTKK